MFRDDDVCDLVQIDLARVRAIRGALTGPDAVQALADAARRMPGESSPQFFAARGDTEALRLLEIAREELEGWRGEIRDSEVVKTHEEAMEEEQAALEGDDAEDELADDELEDDELADDELEDEELERRRIDQVEFELQQEARLKVVERANKVAY